MTDLFTKEKRSWIMSRIRSKWTEPERVIHNHLKGMKIKHRMHPQMPGNPDLIIEDTRRVVFINGCFWHGCPTCCVIPASRKAYWTRKIQRNVKRDLANETALKRNGWHVIKIWEHEIKQDLNKSISKIMS